MLTICSLKILRNLDISVLNPWLNIKTWTYAHSASWTFRSRYDAHKFLQNTLSIYYIVRPCEQNGRFCEFTPILYHCKSHAVYNIVLYWASWATGGTSGRRFNRIVKTHFSFSISTNLWCGVPGTLIIITHSINLMNNQNRISDLHNFLFKCLYRISDYILINIHVLVRPYLALRYISVKYIPFILMSIKTLQCSFSCKIHRPLVPKGKLRIQWENQ